MRLISVFWIVNFIVIGCFQKEKARDPVPAKPTFLVLIDPAHGGRDPGGIADSWVLEKDLVLSIARTIVDSLVANKIPARLSRTADYYLSSPNRLQIAKKIKADLLISVHLNLSKLPTETGWQSYYQANNPQSHLFDRLLHEEMQQIEFLPDRGSCTGEFHLLTHASLPVVMIDLGYITHPHDLQLLTRPSVQKSLAGIFRQALQRYLLAISAG